MTALIALARGRAAAQTLMVDACQVRRKRGQSTSPLTGVVTPDYEYVYTGQCKVQSSRPLGTRMDSAQASIVLMRREVHLPVVASAGVRRGDEVVITSCVHDPDCVGRVLVVHDLHDKSWATSRQLGVTEVT
jgi:hypothetical protein